MLRMCKYGSCRVEWEHTDSGMGAKKYCEKCSKIVRKAYQKKWDKTKRLNRTIPREIL